MNRFSLLTLHSYKDNLLKQLQIFEDVHFYNLSRDETLQFLNLDYKPEEVSRLESEYAKVRFAADKLQSFADIPKGLKSFTTPVKAISFSEFDSYIESYDYQTVYANVKLQDERIAALKAEEARLKTENGDLKCWSGLDVGVKELIALKSVVYFFGGVPAIDQTYFRERFEAAFPCSYLEYIGQQKDEVTAVALVSASEAATAADKLKEIGFSRAAWQPGAAPSDALVQNNARLAEISLEIQRSQDALKAMKDEYPRLMTSGDYFSTAIERAKASTNFLKSENVLMIEGWVPVSHSEELKRIVEHICGGHYHVELKEAREDSEEVPVKLKNNKFVTAFEDITHMYATPRYNEIDPTPVLTPFYFFFFGLMVGDAGYGLLLVILTFIALKFFHLKKGMRNFLQFFHYLGFATIIAGFLTGSFFGFTFFTPVAGPDGPKAILDAQQDIVMMLLLSIGLGVIQIIFGLGVKGYMLIRDGKFLDAVFDSFFMITTVISMICLLAGFLLGDAITLPAVFNQVCWYVFWASLLGLACTQGRSSPSLGGKIGSGLYSVYGLTSYIGDFVSYTRIVALSLSGAYIAYSFNLMSGLFSGPARYIAGPIIVVFAAALNMGLSLLGAYVHTCRLQYVEYFSKFYEGGGVPFEPFALKNTYIEIKEEVL